MKRRKERKRKKERRRGSEQWWGRIFVCGHLRTDGELGGHDSVYSLIYIGHEYQEGRFMGSIFEPLTPAGQWLSDHPWSDSGIKSDSQTERCCECEVNAGYKQNHFGVQVTVPLSTEERCLYPLILQDTVWL